MTKYVESKLLVSIYYGKLRKTKGWINMKQAVHFGGGNIGRGFIGEILHDNDFSITFIDVNESMIDALNQDNGYTIEIYGSGITTKEINNVSGIHSGKNPDAVAEAISNSDIVTCSVGPNNLKYIARNIAEGIKKRFEHKVDQNLDVIACENMVGGSRSLKNKVYTHLNETLKHYADSHIGFPNASVDRIVPNITHDDITTVGVEAFKEWIVETKYSKTYPTLQLKEIKYVKDILPYTERKLLSVNTGHATIAYGGLLLGHEDVVDALNNPAIEAHVIEVLNETGLYLSYMYNLDEEEHALYIQKLLERFKNIDINDNLNRIARNPIQKLGFSERFVIPLVGLYKLNLPHDALIRAIASVFLFDYEEDPQSVILQSRLKDEPLIIVIKTTTGIHEMALIEKIHEEVVRLKALHQR